MRERVSIVVYNKALKPILFSLHPDKAHKWTTSALHISGKVPAVPFVTRKSLTRRYKELEVDWRGHKFTSPVGLAAGLDKNAQLPRMMRALGFGFSTIGSVTSEPCKGNEKPWFYRLPKSGSLAVHVGLANIGVKAVLKRLHSLPQRVQVGFPKVLSVARTNSKEASGVEEGIADYVASIEAAKRSPAVQIFEINISCPNAFGGETYTTPELLEKLLSEVDKVKNKKPIFIKMPLDLEWEEFKPLLDVAVKHGVDGVTISNLTKRRDLVELKEELPDSVLGGLSGAPIRERSTELVRKTYQSHGDKLIIIGVGGVMSAEDAYEKIKAGATFVELVTGLIMRGPFIEELNHGLVQLLKADGYEHISEAVGAEFANTVASEVDKK